MKLEFPPGALRPIESSQLDLARERAADEPRNRAILRFHDHEEAVQRMLNAVGTDSYVRPHRHQDPDKTEVFIALTGRACICRWNDTGELTEWFEISAEGPQRGVEIPPRVWHSLIALDPGTVLFEVIEGPFSASSHKHYASWAPEEASAEGQAFHEALRARVGS